MLTGNTGQATDSYSYLAFGGTDSQSGTTVNRHLYTGEYQDPTTGFYDLRARWMNQGIGRFLTRDTFTGRNYEPASLHQYTYASVDPIDAVDPTGRETLGDVVTAVNNVSNIANDAISTYNFLLGGSDSQTLDGIPTLWDLLMAGLVEGVFSSSEGVGSSAVASPRSARTGGGVEKHHVIPVYCCGAVKQDLVKLDVSDHAVLHAELDATEYLVDAVGYGLYQLIYKRQSPTRPLKKIGRTRVGRAAIAAGLLEFYNVGGWLQEGIGPTIGEVYTVEAPRYIKGGSGTSYPICSRFPP